MRISFLHTLGAILAGAFLSGSGLALAQKASMDASNVACGVRIRVPNYPTIARAAHITGTATAVITVAADGHPARVELTGAHPLLKTAVEKELRTSEFSRACFEKHVRLIFEFVIAGEPSEHPESSIAFVPPNRFVVTTPPGIPMP